MIAMPVRSNLRVLHSLKEAEAGRRITYREVEAETGMTEAQISRYMNNKVVMFHAETLDRLCAFYDCEPGDILVRVNDGQPEGVTA